MNRAALVLALEEALQEFLSTADPSQHTFDLPDHIVAAMVELQTLSDESSNTDEPTDSVHAPVKPGRVSIPGQQSFLSRIKNTGGV